MNDAELIAALRQLPHRAVPAPGPLIERIVTERTAPPRESESGWTMAAGWLAIATTLAGARLVDNSGQGDSARLHDVAETLGRPVGQGLAEFGKE